MTNRFLYRKSSHALEVYCKMTKSWSHVTKKSYGYGSFAHRKHRNAMEYRGLAQPRTIQKKSFDEFVFVCLWFTFLLITRAPSPSRGQIDGFCQHSDSNWIFYGKHDLFLAMHLRIQNGMQQSEQTVYAFSPKVLMATCISHIENVTFPSTAKCFSTLCRVLFTRMLSSILPKL